jgi:hypothetical protein
MMMVAAAVTASRRTREVEHSLLFSLVAIAGGSSVVITVMLATETLCSDIAKLDPSSS